MKKKLIIGSSIILVAASVIMHFFLKDTVTDAPVKWLDFAIGAMFGAGIALPFSLLNDIVKD
jgi:hypothetical protein